MFAVGTCIVYRNLGVYRVESIGHPDSSAFSQDVSYYTLRSLRKNDVVYIPVTSKVKMREVMSRPEADALIGSIPTMPAEVCSSRDRRALQDFNTASLTSQSGRELARLIKSITLKEKMLIEKGRKLGTIDTECRRQAQEMLYEELSCVLEIPFDKVDGYVHSRLAKLKQQPAC